MDRRNKRQEWGKGSILTDPSRPPRTLPTLETRPAIALGGGQVYVVGRAGAHNGNSVLTFEARARGTRKQGSNIGAEGLKGWETGRGGGNS
jgi:hypothetical protein